MKMIPRPHIDKTAKLIIISAVFALIIFTSYPSVVEALSGVCSNCHTMHDSQDGNPVATGGPNDVLLNEDCLGCHSNASNQKIVTIGTSKIPQVFHNDGSGDLAGGNFTYLSVDDNRGHNIVDLANPEGANGGWAPGGLWGGHGNTATMVNADAGNSNLTCAGANGCHGLRHTDSADSNLEALKGAHHKNITTDSTSAFDDDYNSYRFLRGVKGYENDTSGSEWQNIDANTHNEYFGASAPADEFSTCGNCHSNSPAPNIIPPQGTMSGFCGTCHGEFHLTDSSPGVGVMIGIGDSSSSPFLRHPTDVVLPGTGTEYDSYNAYSVEAPVARGVVPDSISPNVNSNAGVEGGIVMCLSCHKAHASEFPDMLRWDIDDMIVDTSGAAAGSGCFTCHAGKDGI